MNELNNFKNYNSKIKIFTYLYFIISLYFIFYFSFNYFQGDLANEISIIFLICFVGLNFLIIKNIKTKLIINWMKIYLSNSTNDEVIKIILKSIVTNKMIYYKKLSTSEISNNILTIYNNLKIAELEENNDESLNYEELTTWKFLIISKYVVLSIIVITVIVNAVLEFVVSNNDIYNDDIEQIFVMKVNQEIQDTVIHNISSYLKKPKGGLNGYDDHGIWHFQKKGKYSNELNYYSDDEIVQIYNPYYNLNMYPHPYISYPLELNKTYSKIDYLYKEKYVPYYLGKENGISSLDENLIEEINSNYNVVDKTIIKIDGDEIECWIIEANSEYRDSTYNVRFLFNEKYGFIELNYLNDNTVYKLVKTNQ